MANLTLQLLMEHTAVVMVRTDLSPYNHQAVKICIGEKMRVADDTKEAE